MSIALHIMVSICGNAPMSIALHIVVSIIGGQCYMQHGFAIGMHLYVLREAITTLFICCLFWIFEGVGLEQVGSTLHAKRSDRSQDLVTQLLKSTCDAVVHLDSNLNIEKSCPQLAGLFLRTSELVSGFHRGNKYHWVVCERLSPK